MNKIQKDTIDFMNAAGQHVNLVPTQISADASKLRIALILEELLETAEAMGVTVSLDGREVKMEDIKLEASGVQDLVGAADGFGDLQYVIYGAASAMGIDLQSCHDEIQRSNMSKFIDGHRAENGKWIKGPSYSPANLEKVLSGQGEMSYVSLEDAITRAFDIARKTLWLGGEEEELVKENIIQHYKV